ncbi:alpha/beta hydrolase family protein [Streptomyces abyssomicinicus]|uniref:alpha/beta hydrolase family protein n=1 Tax=Streptomyces abyssomicinicus TaxID=574929 RepID=UPI00124FC863|nr:alpha/beta fold hydrolase [Streptomyces abyssomicinicus]
MTDTDPTPDLIRVTFPDGSTTDLQVHRTTAPDAEVVLCLPAMGVRSDYYRALARELTEHGCHAVLADHRGTGRSSVRASRRISFGYADLLETELPAVVDMVCEEFGATRIVLAGHSLGGQLGLLFAAVSDRVSHVVLVASGSSWFRRVPGLGGIGRFLGLQWIFATTLLWGYLPQWFPFAGREGRRLVCDWGHEALTGRYRVRGSDVDYETALTGSHVPTLFITFPGDRYIPDTCTAHLAAKLRSARVTGRRITAERLGLARSDHFRWAARPQEVVREVVEWLRVTEPTR